MWRYQEFQRILSISRHRQGRQDECPTPMAPLKQPQKKVNARTPWAYLERIPDLTKTLAFHFWTLQSFRLLSRAETLHRLFVVLHAC